MTSPPIPTRALSTLESVSEVADCYALIAEALHHKLRHLTERFTGSTERVYGLITEEYGLRTRLGILRSDSKNRTVDGVAVSQSELVDLLGRTAAFIKASDSIDRIAFVVISVSVLCVSTFPGKSDTVNFLIRRLETDISN